MVRDAFRDVEKEPDSLKSLLEECEKPLYVGLKYNALSGLLKFQHIKGQFGWYEASFEVLLGPKQPGNKIDVYLAPLIADLKLLWETGMKTYDGYKKEYFNLRAILIWTINDFPAYGNLSGCVTKGEEIYDYLRGLRLHRTNDGLRAQQDLEAIDIKPELQTQPRGNRTWLPPVCYTLNTTEKHQFYETLSTIKVPDGRADERIRTGKPLSRGTVEVVDAKLLDEVHLYTQHSQTFISGLKTKADTHLANGEDICESVRWVAKGPSFTMKKYNGFSINEYWFHRTSRYESRTTQCSGVSLVAHAMQIASAKDSNPVYGAVTYYVWNKKDDFGFTVVNFARLDHQSERFILASQAKQVFYVQDQQDVTFAIVGFTPHKMYKYREKGETDDMLEYHATFDFSQDSPLVEHDDDFLCTCPDGEGILVYNIVVLGTMESDQSSSHDEDSKQRGSTIKGKTTKGKVIVTYNKKGVPTGVEATKLAFSEGMVVRSMVPITYATWRDVEQEKKEDLWQYILMDFKLDPRSRKNTLQSIGTKWKNFKHYLYKNFIEKFKNDPNANLLNPPEILYGVKKKIEKRFNQIEGAIEKLQKGMNHTSEGASFQGWDKADFEDNPSEELLDTSCYLAIDIASNIVAKGTIVKHNNLSGENIEVIMEMSVQGDALLLFPLDE
ncbi:hypothetical protein F3Y22_tig00002193pilonHSYRG00046 [Hibiscus syriacus]|uniref:DUF4216 domain-containing protein n=1 Tax=Hibiscus syriacus TaxID=106335 RepID=A0A6A3CT30_HIBSY|nr:hypothetical protein F3Y22_tig00002193pilonHSYRG00046 [Hibiscus syriacus]